MGLDGILNVILNYVLIMRCLIISDTTTHSKYWYYKYVQLLGGGRKHTFAPPPHFSYWGGARRGAPPLSTPLINIYNIYNYYINCMLILYVFILYTVTVFVPCEIPNISAAE